MKIPASALKKFFFISLTISILTRPTCFSQNTQWRHIRPDNTGVGGDYHNIITGDQLGNIWTAGFMPFWEQGSVVRYDGSIFTNWGSYEGLLPNARVTAIDFDNNGYLWVGTEGGIAKYDGQTWQHFTTANTALPYDFIMGLDVDANNTVWVTYGDILTLSYGYASFNGTSWSYVNGTESTWLPLNATLAMTDGLAVDNAGNKWIATSNGLVKIDQAGNWSLLDQNNSGR